MLRRSRFWTFAYVLVASAVGLTADGSAFAATDANHAAYDYALKCYVAGGVLASDRHGDQDVAAIKAKAQTAYNAAYKMGGVLGYSRDHVSADLNAYSRVEAALMIRDAGYFQQTQATCQQLGMM